MKNSINLTITLIVFAICTSISSIGFSQTANYYASEIAKSASFTDNSSDLASTETSAIETEEEAVTNPASYISAINSLKEILAKKISYTELALDYKVEGEIDVRLELDGNGKIKDSKILKGLGMGLDEEVLKAIKQMSKKDFAILNTIQANKVYTLSISFRLPE